MGDDCLKQVLPLLSDGAFKVYVYVCLHADRHTAQLPFRVTTLAGATGHSRRSLAKYLEELRRADIAVLVRAANQHEFGRIEIRDAFWPYVKTVAHANYAQANGELNNK